MRPRGAPSPTWRAFLNSHIMDLVSVDLFTVPTVRCQVLFVFLVLAHHRHRVVHFNATERPMSQWTAQHIVEAFPFDTAPKYLLRDRDGIYRGRFRARVRSLGIEEVLTAPGSPWQNPYVERLIGRIRRDCLDHVIVLNDRHLKRMLASYVRYDHSWRPHRAREMDSPNSRPVQPPELGEVVAFPDGLQRHDERRLAQLPRLSHRRKTMRWLSGQQELPWRLLTRPRYQSFLSVAYGVMLGLDTQPPEP